MTVLDVNAAYLSALKVWLPIGKLEHTPGSDGRARSRGGGGAGHDGARGLMARFITGGVGAGG